jgi:hypothetical protein
MSLTITGPSAAVIPAPPTQLSVVQLSGVSVDINPPHALLITYTLNPSGLQKTCTATLTGPQLAVITGLVKTAIETNEGWSAGSASVTGS